MNIPTINLDIIDILPFNLPPPGNTLVGTGAVMGSTWQPFFLSPISTAGVNNQKYNPRQSAK